MAQEKQEQATTSVVINEEVTVFKKKYYDNSTQSYKEYLACVITLDGETFELKVNDYDKKVFRYILKNLYDVDL